MDHSDPTYSGNVRQSLHNLYNTNDNSTGSVVIYEGYTSNYSDWQASARFCLAPYVRQGE